MPYKIIPLKGGKFKVESPNSVRAKATTKSKAKSQVRLLNAIEFGNFKPKKKQ